MKERSVNGWERRNLIEIAAISSGNSIPAKDRVGKYAAKNGPGRYFISTKDVGFDGQINPTTDVIIPPIAQSQFKLAKLGSTLVCSEGGSAGRKVGFLEEDAHYGNKLFAITGSDEVCPKLIYYFCQTEDFIQQFQDRKTGLIGGVSLSKFKTIEVPVPPLKEQLRIVAVLDEALEGLARARAHSETNLNDLSELVGSQYDLAVSGAFCGPETAKDSASQLLAEISKKRKLNGGAKKQTLKCDFVDTGNLRDGWQWLPLGDLASKISDGVHKTPHYVTEGIPFVMVKNLTAGSGISFADTKFITEHDHIEYIKRTHPEKNDILITKDGTIGVVRKIETDRVFSIFVSLALVKPIDVRLSDYLTIALQAPSIQKQIIPKGAALKHLYLNDLRRLPVPIGPFSELESTVTRMADVASDLQRLQLKFRRKLQDLDDLRQVLLQKAFAGELR